MKYTRKVLKNGLRIITVPMKDNPTATVLVLVEAGSKYEKKENNGISHFLEHMCFKGTTNRPTSMDISKELDGIGSHYNAFTSQEHTGYYAKADYKNIDKILDVVSDMYLNPVFPEQEIEKEKGVIIEEINMYLDLPKAVVQDEFFKLLYGDQPAGWNIAGPKENIKNMKRSDFIDYRSKHYVASSTTVIVAGKIKEADVFKKVTKLFKNIGKWKKEGKEKVIELQKAPQATVYYKDTDQTHLIIGTRSYDTYNKYNSIIRIMIAILSGGLSSRLFEKMRNEMGICYYVYADNDSFTDHGIFSVSAGVDSNRVKEAIVAILAELKKLKTELINKEELNKVKQFLIGNLNLGLESSDSIASFYGYQEVMRKNIKKPEDIIKEIKAVTAEEIKFVAERIFKDELLNLAIVGKFKDKQEFLNILKF
ncbi:MAG: pitrilysin family protein [Candidatus Pacebacteria bacterium]|nr:pitrilysin family protein [Candidatus Paceibacterota bacterium]